MYPNTRKVWLFLIPGILMAIPEIIWHVHFVFKFASDNRSVKANYTQIESILGYLTHLFFFLFLSWEFVLKKEWKSIIIILPVFIFFTVINYFDLGFYKTDIFSYSGKSPTTWFFVYNILFSGLCWFGFIYGYLKGGIKNAFISYTLGVVFSALIYMIRINNFFDTSFNENLFLSLVYILFIYIPVGYTFYFLLNFYGNWFQGSAAYSSKVKKQPIGGNSFFVPFVIIYTLYILLFAAYFTPRRVSVSGGFIMDVEWVFIVYFVLTIVGLFAILHVLSTLIIQKLNVLKLSIGFTYLLSFVPVVNIFTLLYIAIKASKSNENTEQITTRNNEEFDNDGYKRFVITINIIGYIVGLILISRDAPASVIKINSAFYFVNIVILIFFYSYRLAWIALIFSLIFLTFFRFYYKMADEMLIISSLISGLTMVYLYAQSFHPISLDFGKEEMVEEKVDKDVTG